MSNTADNAGELTPAHYTYLVPNRGNLCQGDILARTPELLAILGEWHSYYARETYPLFMVVTQSCDLVRRAGAPPNSRYITLAAVRPLEDALRREAEKYQDDWQRDQKCLSEKGWGSMTMFAESLIENNQPNYFYIHTDYAMNIPSPHCAFLRLTVAIKREHYEICLSAKRAQLHDTFQAKLGWLIGNLYSRVGTAEWDDHYGTGKRGEQVAELMRSTFRKVSEAKIRQARAKLENPSEFIRERPAEFLRLVNDEKIVSKQVQFRELLSGLVGTFALRRKFVGLANSLLLPQMDALLDLASNKEVALDERRRAVLRAITDAIGVEADSWTRLDRRFVQEIVQNESIKSLLRD